MKRMIITVIVVVVLAVILIQSSLFTVNQWEQVIITQFGRPQRVVTEPGLAVRTPFIQKVHRLEKRLIPWDGDPENMTTKDKKTIFVDFWARWRIVDPQKFFVDVKSVRGGQMILDGLIDSAVRDVVARYNLIECVRSTNEPLEYADETLLEGGERKQERIVAGRDMLEEEMLASVNKQDLRAEYGIEVSGVHIKRVNYIESVRNDVYERMKSERMRIAQLLQSEAQEERNRILGNTRKELDEIEGEMQQRSAEIRGAADAEVINIYAGALSRDPEFFEFLRRLDAYKQTFGPTSRLILSTDNDLLELLKGDVIKGD
jgi:membrane protease subunit HflC